ncbi:MAG: LamG domain-containing protein, partial [Deltaproteobacteria bacterium]
MMNGFGRCTGRKRVALLSLFLAIEVLFLLSGGEARAQEHEPDPNTLLLLHFNDALTGAEGETPTAASGISYAAGVFGRGVELGANNQLSYPSAGNIDSTEGTLEFWIQPHWEGNDGQNHFVLRFGWDGGMLFGKDGGNFWRIILNRYGVGNPEIGTGLYVTEEWHAEEWHHCAFTWNASRLQVYIDGRLRASRQVTVPLNAVSDATFQIGADGSQSFVNAVLDELRISDIERSAEEIEASYLAAFSAIDSLAIEPGDVEIYETWHQSFRLFADTPLGRVEIPASAASWVSSDSGVVRVDEPGRVTGIRAGLATIWAAYEGKTASAQVRVVAPVLPPEVEAIDPFLATPASGARYEMPVVILQFLPTLDGVNIDAQTADWSGTIAQLK